LERILVTLPRELLDDLDARSERLQRKRSRVIREALAEWLEIQRRKEFEELLAEGYREQASKLAEIAEDFAAAQAEATKDIWRWDD